MKDITLSQHTNLDFSNKLLSHAHVVGPDSYWKCDFSSADMSGVRYEEVIFNDCDFSNVDASNSEFIDCDFINCAFIGASLSNSLFSGCLIENRNSALDRESFSRASLTSSLFSASRSRRCKINNIIFSNISFRNLSFRETDFLNCNFRGVPFEGATFSSCVFDELNLKFGAVKGIQFDRCKFDKFYTTLDKLFSVVGLWDISNSSIIRIYPTSDSEVPIAKNKNDLYRLISENIKVFLSSASLYEFINGISFLSKSCFHKEMESSENSDLRFITGNSENDISKGIDFFVLETSKIGRIANISNINFAMNVLLFEKCASRTLLDKVLDLIRIAKEQRYSFQNLSEVYLKFETLKQQRTDDYICLTFVDSSHQVLSYSSASEFSTTLSQLMLIIEVSDYSVHSRTQGSIVEKIILTRSKLLNSYPKLISIVFLLGFQFDVQNTPDGLDFHIEFSLKDSVVGEMASAKEVQEKIKSIKLFDKDIKNPSEEDISLLGAKLESNAKLKEKLQTGAISVRVERATVNQILPQGASNIFLQNLSK